MDFHMDFCSSYKTPIYGIISLYKLMIPYIGVLYDEQKSIWNTWSRWCRFFLLSFFSRFLRTGQSAPTTIVITFILMIFQFSGKVLVFGQFFTCFYFQSMVNWNSKTYNKSYHLLVDNIKFSLILVARLYFKVPKNSMRLIFKDRFWFSYTSSSYANGFEFPDSLSLSRHPSLFFIVPFRSSVRTVLMHISLCSACIFRLTWIVCVMGGWWPYSYCFVGCCFPNLLRSGPSILV